MKLHAPSSLLLFIRVGIWCVLFIPLIISPHTLFPFQTGKGIVFRIMIELLAALYLWLVMTSPQYRPSVTALSYAILAFSSTLILTSIAGVNPYRSFFGDLERMEGLVGVLHAVVLFFILSGVMQQYTDWLRVFKISLFASGLVFSYGIAQKFGDTVYGAGFPHISSTFGHHAFAATYALFHVFFALIVLRWDHTLRWRCAASLLLVANLVLLVWTANRGAQVGLIIAILTTGVVLAIYERGVTRRVAIIGIIAGLAVPCVIALFHDAILESDLPLAVHRLAALSFTDPTVNTRLLSLSMSWDAFKERPLLGWGLENFGIAYNLHFNPSHFTFEYGLFDRAHNKIAEIAVVAGSLGLISYLSLFAIGLLRLLSVARQTDSSQIRTITSLVIGLGAGYFVQNLFLFDTTISYILFFSMLAFTNFLIQPSNTGDLTHTGTNAARGTTHVLMLSCFALMVIAIAFVYNWQPYQASVWAQKAAKEKTPALTIQAYERALEYGGYPKAEILRFMSHTALEHARHHSPEWKRFVALTITELERFVNAEPFDIRLFIPLGQLYSRLAATKPTYLDRAETTLRKSTELIPRWPMPYLALGVRHLRTEQYEEALQVFRFILTLDDTHGPAYWWLGIAQAFTDQPEQAHLAFEAAVEHEESWRTRGRSRNANRMYSVLEHRENVDRLCRVLQTTDFAIIAHPFSVMGWPSPLPRTPCPSL